ncbi:hypothetical protein YQE_01721, partial [Dendroctonus ponderosae]
MYRCLMLNKPDRELHRILFRSSPTDELNHYQLNTVTYGMSCASFLAIKALRQVAIDIKDQYPTVSNTILSHFYVDDLLPGSSLVEEANQTIKDLTRILQSYGFNLGKFVSSNPQVLDNIHDDKTIKTLGLTWNSHLDTFQYTFHITPHTRVTKRTILSTAAKIFDPLGLVEWIALPPNQLQTFVANRISKIQQSTEASQWFHISSENNPADIISRGLDGQALKSSNLWWNGPALLHQTTISLVLNRETSFPEIPELKKSSVTMIIQPSPFISVNDKISSFTRLQRVMSYCLRFIKNCSSKWKKEPTPFSGFQT